MFNELKATFNFYNSTIAFNQALRGVHGTGDSDGSDGQGIGGGVFSDDGTEFAFSTIFADNTADDSAPDFSGDLQASACLFGNTAGTTIIPGSKPNLTNVDPLLGPLTDNGGPTFTHALLSGSPAIDHGANPLHLSHDQRGDGFPCVQGGGADIGAFESGGATP